MISVITIVRNGINDIEKTIYSVLRQNYQNIEYIIKDGLSTDGTSERIRDIIDKEDASNIVYVNQKDHGIYNAMNQAISYCHGEWIMFLNCGDEFIDENILKDLFDDKARYANHGVIYGDVLIQDETRDFVWRADISLINKKMPFSHQSCFVRREFFNKHMFNEELKIAADYNLILDLFLDNVAFFNSNKIISVFDLTGVSSTKYVDRYKEKNMVLQAHGMLEKNKIRYWADLLMEYLKEKIDCVVPPKLKKQLRRYYKKYVKKYEEMR